MSRSLLVAAFLLVASCARATVISVVEDGGVDTDATTDGNATTDMLAPRVDMGEEPLPGGECDQQDDCDACATCAASHNPRCTALWQDCSNETDCSDLLDCVTLCTTNDCFQACGDAHPASTDAVNGVYQCLICNACSADCRAGYSTWCESPPL